MDMSIIIIAQTYVLHNFCCLCEFYVKDLKIDFEWFDSKKCNGHLKRL